MSGEINISVLLRFMAEQARREIAGTSGDLKTLGAAAAEAGQKGATAGTQIDTTGTSIARTASEAINATAAMGRAAVSTAGMRDTVTGLGAANIDAAQATASMSTAIGVAQTAMRSAMAAGAGYTVSIGDQVDAMLRHSQASEAWQAQLDGIRAKFNPLFAASKQYEVTLREIADAEKIGALNAMEASAARERAAQSIRPMPVLLDQYGTSTNVAAGATANLFAQWNDIGVMMAAGQNPLQLAMQQGTQVSQVLMQLGGGKAALKAIGTSFMAMLNPISLATIGIIAFGAAGVQWLAGLREETRTFDDDLEDLNTTLDRMRSNLGLLSDIRLEQKFGSLSAEARDLAQAMIALDRASELKLLRDLLEKAPNEVAGESLFQRWTRGLAIGATGSPDSYAGRLSANYERQNMAENYAKLGAANSYDDFLARAEEISRLAENGNIEEVTKKLGELQKAMSGGAPITAMKKELLSFFIDLQKAALKAAEIEALFNGSARAAAIKDQTDQIVTSYNQQAEIARAIVQYGAASSKIDEIRAAHAREALEAKLEEMGANLNGLEAMRARAALEGQIAAQAELARAKREKDQTEYFADIERQAELSDAILKYGEDSAAVDAIRAQHAQEILRYKLQEKGWSEEMIASAITLTKAEQDRQKAIKASTALRQSNQELERLRLEISLIGQSERARQRALAAYDAELEIRRQGLDVASAEAEALRRNAVLTADLTARKDRLSEAWDRVTNAGESAIDDVFDRLEEGDIQGALSEITQDIGDMINELAVRNPLKNIILGTDLPTLSDAGGIGGIFDRLTGKAGPNAASSAASAMAVTTPVVNITAGAVSGLGAGAMNFTAGAMPGMAAATSNVQSVQSEVWNFFAGKGLKSHQIAGIMGNISAESGFNPLAIGDNGSAFGLFQHNDRAPALMQAIGGMGNLGDVNAQLEFAWQELLTSESGPLRKLLASKDLYSATHAFTGFERPSGYDAENPAAATGWSQRLAAAEAAMARFGTTTTMATEGLSTLDGGFNSLGQMLSSGLRGLFGGGQSGGGSGGGFWSFISSAAGNFLGLPGFATGGETPDALIAVSNGEYRIPAEIAQRNRAALQAINTGRQLPAGLITGPGTGTSDSIMMPARAGDYIVNAAATRANRPLLDAMVRGRPQARYATGGQVLSRSSISMPAVAAAAASGSSQQAVDNRPVIQINNNSSARVEADMEETTDAQGRRTWRLTMADMVGDAMTTPGGGARKRLAAMGVRPKGARR